MEFSRQFLVTSPNIFPSLGNSTFALGIAPPPSSSAGGVHLEGDEYIHVPEEARISTGNADAWGAPGVTSSPKEGDNNPLPWGVAS